jgi:glycosyltransferase involved in cell wall biosynthesis
VDVEYLRWWDSGQQGDLIHFFSAANNAYLLQARAVKVPVVMTQLFTDTCNRSNFRLALQGFVTRTILALPFGEGLKQQLTWRAYHNCTHNIVGIEAERHVLQTVYGVPPDRISIVPSGLSKTYLRAGHGARNEPHLICTGTITQRKNSVELAEMAHAAQTPILFTGKPYHPEDPYWLRFKELVDGRWVKHYVVPYGTYEDSDAEMVRLLQSARGFVIMSNFENWCLSAHEAVACGLPLLVQDQKWSRERFGDQARYFKHIGVSQQNVDVLKQFYREAPDLPAPVIDLPGWTDVAVQLKAVYQRVLNSSH